MINRTDTQTPAAPSWHAAPFIDVAATFETDLADGLDPTTASSRLAETGPNVIETERATPWYRVVMRQFADVLIGILAIGAALSFALGEVVDGVTILAIVVLNAVMGFVQEWKAEQAIEALAKMLAPQADVIRAGAQLTIDAADIVPGDLVVLSAGSRIAADLRIVNAVNLEIDESALTGESAPVAKRIDPDPPVTPLAERAAMAWMGTAATNGHGAGIAVGTGMATEFGRIAELTRAVGRETTPLQRKLASLGKLLGILGISVSVAVTIIGVLRGNDPVEMALTGVSLAVAVVPEGLPAVVTITLALGIRTMAQRRALIRRLPAAETLGAATIICTDKTGTLTENEMSVQEIWTGFRHVALDTAADDDAAVRDLLETGLLCNHARLEGSGAQRRAIGEPTETALAIAADRIGLRRPGGAPRRELSFSSSRKRMTVILDGEGGPAAHAKGAPEIILDRCSSIATAEGPAPLDDAARADVRTAYEEMARRGLRTLALARRALDAAAIDGDADVIEHDLTLLGIAGIMDPPRAEVPDAVDTCHDAGIGVVMITGDAAPTAGAIAEQVHLSPPRVVTGIELGAMSDLELLDAIEQQVAFARTTPEDKLRIVTVLQGAGHIAAMTGDGVNDAPALKKADIGIAMGKRGTDVARGAADMVLTDDNFASIVGAVEEGRRQYDNITKFVRYLLSSNVGEVVAILLNIALGGPLILLPVQILWMNLVTDGLSAVALGLEPAERGLMERPPRNPDEPIVTRRAALMIGILGTYIGLATLLVFQIEIDGDLARAQTMAFTGIVVFEKLNVFNFRGLEAPLRHVGWRSNPWILAAVASSIGLQISAVYVPFLQSALHTVPLSLGDWGFLVLVGLPVLVVTETIKTRRWNRRHGNGAV